MAQKALRFSLLISSIAVCIYFILFGQRGAVKYYQTAKEIEYEKNKVAKLELENAKLRSKIDRWQKDDFEKEKYARQNLQMSKPDEMLFVTTQT